MPGDSPALDMLTAHGEAQCLRSIGSELVEPGGHALSIQQFFGMDHALKHFCRGIFSICRIKAGDGGIEAFRISGHKGLLIYVGSSAKRQSSEQTKVDRR